LKLLGFAATMVAGLAFSPQIFAADQTPMMESCNKMMQTKMDAVLDSGKPNEHKEMPTQPEKKG
jgi:hypothetical protein